MRCTHCGNDICAPCWKSRTDRHKAFERGQQDCTQDGYAHVLAALDEAEDDRRRALKRADAFTLETQTCDEAVQALCEMIVAARADRDELRAAGGDLSATLARKANDLQRERDELQRRQDRCPECTKAAVLSDPIARQAFDENRAERGKR